MSAIEEKIQSIGCSGLKMEIYKFIAPRCVFCNGGPETWMGEKFLPLDWNKRMKVYCRFNCCSKTCYYGMKLRKKEIKLNDIPSRFITRELISIAAENKLIDENFTVPEFIMRDSDKPEIFKMIREIIKSDYTFVGRVPQILTENDYSVEEIQQIMNAEFYDYYVRNCRTGRDFLSLVPEEFLTEELCRVAIEKDALNLAFVPEQFFIELFQLAVTKNADALQFVPLELYTYDLVLAAVTSVADVIRYVPLQFIDEHLFRVALSTRGQVIDMIQYLDFEMDYYKIVELSTLAVSQDGLVLDSIPTIAGVNTFDFDILDRGENSPSIEEMRENGRKLVHIAVNQNSWALRYVHKKLLTPELIKLAVTKNGEALQFVPKEFLTPELIELAFISSIHVIQFIDDDWNSDTYREEDELLLDSKYVTKEIAESAVKQHGYYLRYIPPSLVTQDLCELAIKNSYSGLTLNFIPSKYRTKKLLTLAVRRNSQNLNSMSGREITIQMTVLAVSKDEWLAKTVPRKYKKFIKDFFEFTDEECRHFTDY